MRKEARGKYPVKERLRRKLGISDRESFGPSLSAHTEVWAKTPSPIEKAPSSTYPFGSVRIVKEKHKRSDRSISERCDRGVLPPSARKKKQGEESKEPYGRHWI